MLLSAKRSVFASTTIVVAMAGRAVVEMLVVLGVVAVGTIDWVVVAVAVLVGRLAQLVVVAPRVVWRVVVHLPKLEILPLLN